MKICIKKNNKGFTLIELMVATSLFMVIMISALGSLLMLINESRNGRANRIAMDNVNFAMESMARSIRMGSNYYCGSIGSLSDVNSSLGCDSGESVVSFVPQANSNSRVEYRLEDNTIKRFDSSNSFTGVPVISQDVSISKLKFFVNINGVQPKVYIIIEGSVNVKGIEKSFAIQTLASQRNF